MSLYKGCKDVLIEAYEGSIFIEDIPNSISKNDIIDRAASELHKIGLYNVSYTLNPTFEESEKAINEGAKVVKWNEDK